MAHVFQAALTPRRAIAALLVAGAALLVLAAPHAAEAKSHKANVSAMSLNLYFGANVEGALVATDLPALQTAAGAAYNQLLASNPTNRLKAQAKIIKKRKPDVIGVQEAATLFTGPPGPIISRATAKQFDFIQQLRQLLKNRDVPYRVAYKQQNVDIEVSTGVFMNVRLVDYDAILVRKTKRIKVQKTSGDNFDAALSVPIPLNAAVNTTVPRGYAQANLKIRGAKVNVVNTHLESLLGNIRAAQAAELAKQGGPLDSKRPTIVLGDLNSDPRGNSAAAYNTIIAAGFKNRSQTKNTCCYDPDLSGGTLTSWVDSVLGSKGVKERKSKRTGTKTPWPSDHAGVYSELQIRW